MLLCFNISAFLSPPLCHPASLRGFDIFFAFSQGFACGLTLGYCSVARRSGLKVRFAFGSHPAKLQFVEFVENPKYRRAEFKNSSFVP